jgi:LuxR family transcriptional regulator, maltose regulon positive regulatory protein
LLNKKPIDHAKYLIETKLFVPPLQKNLVDRPQILEQIEQSAQKKIIFIHAPAGYGKTTAVVQWIHAYSKSATWYAIDAGDNDLSRFLSYIVYGIGHLKTGVCQTLLPLINSSDPPPTYVLLAQLINDLNCLEQRSTLVLDDYHLVSNQEIHSAFLYIIQHLPPNLQIVILSRSELPFSISNLRLAGQISELNLFDLRFTPDDSEKFINTVLKLGLSKTNLIELVKRTDGWVSGLQLAAMGMRSRGNADNFIQHLTGDDRFITSYLGDEVINELSEEYLDFLLSSSIIDRFCPMLMNHILDMRNSHELIKHLEKHNSFIIPLDNQQIWYRYHHLFADLLQKRLHFERPDHVSEILGKASIWHEQNGNIEESITYAQKAQDHARVAELLNRSVCSIILRGRHERAIQSILELPADHIRKHQNIWAHLILAQLDRGAFHDAKFQLERLWGGGQINQLAPELQASTLGYLKCFQAAILTHTELNAKRVIELTTEAVDLLRDTDSLGLSIAHGHFGAAQLHLGNLSSAAQSLDQAIELSKKTDYDLIYLLWFSYRAQVEFNRGNLSRARILFGDAEAYAATRGLNKSNVFINAIVGLGRIHYEWNELEVAKHYLIEGVKLAEYGENIDRVIQAYEAYFRYLITVSEFDEVSEKLVKFKSLAASHHNPAAVIIRIEALEIEIALARDDLKSVPQEIHKLSPESEKVLKTPTQNRWISQAKFLSARGEVDQAIAILHKLIHIAEDQKRSYSLIYLNTYLAVELQKQNMHSDAKVIMQRVCGVRPIRFI